MSDRAYYVINEQRGGDRSGREWKVKLENGPVLSTHGRTGRNDAIREAKRLGRKNRRDVMVNYRDGRTGAQFYSYPEDLRE